MLALMRLALRGRLQGLLQMQALQRVRLPAYIRLHVILRPGEEIEVLVITTIAVVVVEVVAIADQVQSAVDPIAAPKKGKASCQTAKHPIQKNKNEGMHASLMPWMDLTT